MTSGGPALLVEQGRKEYRTSGGRHAAVSDVSLTVATGTVHGLLGPNGAGKTTTLKMLLGLVRPTAGRFEIGGVSASAAHARTTLGFLPEQPYFSPQLTAARAMALYGALSGLDRTTIKARTSELFDRVGLRGKEGVVLKQFSRGMLQRLGLAQALIGSPAVLILDEPASGLDPVGQRDVRNLMLELREGGTAILLSSHQLSEVEAVCDEVTILDRGRVAARGDIDDLLNAAGSTAVRAAGPGEALPASVAALVDDVAFSGGVWGFSVPETATRAVVDSLDDAGWRVLGLAPKRESLEDYFATLLSTPDETADAS